jgi:hypothetical protein
VVAAVTAMARRSCSGARSLDFGDPQMTSVLKVFQRAETPQPDCMCGCLTQCQNRIHEPEVIPELKTYRYMMLVPAHSQISAVTVL